MESIVLLKILVGKVKLMIVLDIGINIKFVAMKIHTNV